MCIKKEIIIERRILRCILSKFLEALINPIIDGTPLAHIITTSSRENLHPSKYGEVKSKYPFLPHFLEIFDNTAKCLLFSHKDS